MLKHLRLLGHGMEGTSTGGEVSMWSDEVISGVGDHWDSVWCRSRKGWYIIDRYRIMRSLAGEAFFDNTIRKVEVMRETISQYISGMIDEIKI